MKAHIDRAETLLEALIKIFPESSRTTLRSWVKEGRILVEGKRLSKANAPVEEGQTLTLEPKKKFNKIPILYEDRHLVVIEKPAGLLSVADDRGLQLSAHDILKEMFHTQRVYPVHRLDRDTSGVMMFAYTIEARDGLKSQFADHSVERTYAALVEGSPKEKVGTWKSHLLEERGSLKMKSAPFGRLSITHYRAHKEIKGNTLLYVNLETGRKNQIRVHCSENGHPVVGDKKYGSEINPLGRLGLHAIELGFFHPILKKRMHFRSPAPF